MNYGMKGFLLILFAYFQYIRLYLAQIGFISDIYLTIFDPVRMLWEPDRRALSMGGLLVKEVDNTTF